MVHLNKKKLLWYMLNKTVIVVQLQQKSYCGTSYHKGGTSYKKEVIVVYIKQKSYCGTTSTKKLLWYILNKKKLLWYILNKKKLLWYILNNHKNYFLLDI